MDFLVNPWVNPPDFMDFIINLQIYLKFSDLSVINLHCPLQVLIVGMKFIDFVGNLWFTLVVLIVSSIYSFSDLFVFCLDLHFSNPMSDPRMVLRWSRLWFFDHRFACQIRTLDLLIWPFWCHTGICVNSLNFLDCNIWGWKNGLGDKVFILHQRDLATIRVIPKMVVGSYAPIFWITHVSIQFIHKS